MKQNFFKTGALFSLIVLTFSSCLKDELEEPVIPDPPSWSHSATWKKQKGKEEQQIGKQYPAVIASIYGGIIRIVQKKS